MSSVPFGPSKPSRVPCPPASMSAATFPSRTACIPAFVNSSRREAISSFFSPSMGAISPSGGRTRASSEKIVQSTRSSSEKKRSCSAPSSSRIWARRCSCPFAIRSCSTRSFRSIAPPVKLLLLYYKGSGDKSQCPSPFSQNFQSTARPPCARFRYAPTGRRPPQTACLRSQVRPPPYRQGR